MTDDARGTFDDLAYLVDCHKATGCLFQSTDYGARVKGNKWDLGRLNDGVRFLVLDVENKRKQGDQA